MAAGGWEYRHCPNSSWIVIPTGNPLAVIPTERSERRNLGSIYPTGTRLVLMFDV